MKKLIFLLFPLLAGCNDRFNEYRMIQQAYPNARIEPVDYAGNEFDSFLVVDTNNVARVVFFGDSLVDTYQILAEIPTAVETP